jgi:hypothetical protein
VEESFWKRLWTCRLTDYWWWWWWWSYFLLPSISENCDAGSADVAICLLTDVQVLSQVNQFWIGGGWRGSRIGFSPTTSVFPCHYSATTPYWCCIHLLTRQYNLTNWQTSEIKHLSFSLYFLLFPRPLNTQPKNASCNADKEPIFAFYKNGEFLDSVKNV